MVNQNKLSYWLVVEGYFHGVWGTLDTVTCQKGNFLPHKRSVWLLSESIRILSNLDLLNRLAVGAPQPPSTHTNCATLSSQVMIISLVSLWIWNPMQISLAVTWVLPLGCNYESDFGSGLHHRVTIGICCLPNLWLLCEASVQFQFLFVATKMHIDLFPNAKLFLK